MGGFFNIDGTFYKVGNILADIIILSIFWILFSIPIVTIGPATTALFYVATRRISDKEGYLFKDFWSSFKLNFKKGIIISTIFALIFLVAYINIMNAPILGEMAKYIIPFQFIIVIESIIVSIFIYPLLARFDMGIKELFKTSFFMANRHLLTTIACCATLILVVIASMAYLPIILVASGIYAFITSYLFRKIFRKYKPEMDLTEEEKLVLAQELERKRLSEIKKRGKEEIVVKKKRFFKN